MVTSGNHDPVVLHELLIQLITPDVLPGEAAGSSDSGTQHSANPTGRAGHNKAASGTIDAALGAGTSNDSAKAKDAQAENTLLEVYSPPSVRHGRVDSLRAALAQAKKP